MLPQEVLPGVETSRHVRWAPRVAGRRFRGWESAPSCSRAWDRHTLSLAAPVLERLPDGFVTGVTLGSGSSHRSSVWLDDYWTLFCIYRNADESVVACELYAAPIEGRAGRLDGIPRATGRVPPAASGERSQVARELAQASACPAQQNPRSIPPQPESQA